jgi:serine/threonine protein kinase
MDWVDGAPLYQQALYPATSPQVTRMLSQLARALAELHALGVTPPGTHPGTPLYRAPETWGRVLNREPSEHTHSQPADGLFALSVTACRLLTGEYPGLSTPRRDEHGRGHVDSVLPPEALRRDERLSPRLRSTVPRMLALRPKERGTAERSR